jgi:23S rRNA (cytidine1920-2'-O)/16S rRNA (cytidine1409-2'-O)-methyltransferase
MKTTVTRLRLDQHLHEAGHFDSREKAQRAILAGQVTVGGQIADKPGTKVNPQKEILITGRDRYVGRGGHKLEGALTGFGIDPMGLSCLDLGSSTGGFTDCLLQHWAAHVTAVDVGRGQLAWSLRQDPRVEVREGINARYLTSTDFERRFDLIVGDLSFISLTKILPAAFELLNSEGVMVVLIKPQFELSRADIGKGGIVRDTAARQRAVNGIRLWVTNAGHRFDCVMESPLPGTSGNIEFLALLRRGDSTAPLPEAVNEEIPPVESTPPSPITE